MIQIQEIGKQTGQKFWRSLEELAGTRQFSEWVTREFPEGATDALDPNSRRRFLQLMAASMGLAGMTACRRPLEKILPYAKSVEGVIHGNPLQYATVMPMGIHARGVVVESFEGRPVKLEGNPKHPSSNGRADAYTQASVLSLYDPDRAKEVLQGGKSASWAAFDAAAKPMFAGDGEGVRILSTAVISPTLAGLRKQLLAKLPKAKWVEYEPINDDTALAGAEAAFGEALRPNLKFANADVVLALDCDFLMLDNQSLGWVRDFTQRRKLTAPHHIAEHETLPEKAKENPEQKQIGIPVESARAAAQPKSATTAEPIHPATMNRLYAVESNYTVTGAMADHRLRMRAADIQNFVFDLARELGAVGGLKVLGQKNQWITGLAKDLKAKKGRSIVTAGPRQPMVVHAVVALINQTLGNIGETVVYAKAERTSKLEDLAALTKEMSSGAVKTLLILGGNPVYTAPADLDFSGAMKKVANTIYLGPEVDETAVVAGWHVPESHYLEAWGDAADFEGTTSVQQPLIEPLYGTRSAIELVAGLLSGKAERGYEFVKAQWKLDDKAWRQVVHDGVSASKETAAKVSGGAKVEGLVNAAAKPGGGMEVTFFPSAGTYDGRFANNAWLQEAPEPMTKIVWDNTALLSAKTAKDLGVEYGDLLLIEVGGHKVEAPALVQPGHADNSISLTLGYGRTQIGRVGREVGYNAYKARTTSGFGIATAVSVSKAGGTYKLVTTQEHHDQAGRPIVREASLERFEKEPDFASEEDKELELFQLFPAWDYSKGNQWGMAIDLNSCIGCNACLVACQAENNIPVVGKDQVSRGREMHWIRLDRYFVGDDWDDPHVAYQPMACQQCENAPCESVCPVAATIHSPEGLNDMAYNRCVGTRYCNNNCPYKVRRFNYLDWHKHLEEVQKMVFNPNATVRSRGVMEKCNYCVQRIQETKIAAHREGRRAIRDGEIQSACQQTCPSDAIVFGNINDPNSAVSKLKKDPRNYTLLAELNVKPRTTYLAKLRNPNPELA